MNDLIIIITIKIAEKKLGKNIHFFFPYNMEKFMNLWKEECSSNIDAIS